MRHYHKKYQITKTFWLVFILVLATTASFAQSLRVSGKISDEKGVPLSGVSVVEKDKDLGVTTDSTGSFTITVPHKTAVLVFSSINYQMQEVPVNGKSTLNVLLKPIVGALEEVVLIGYGEAKRKDVTGSIGSANMKDVSKAPVASYVDALAGRVAGVQVSSNDGQPGATSNIVIRGNNSLTQDNSPLFVIDGFPIESPDNNAENPVDIESIDILKDASAAAIYGARGANGVVIITTKRGKNSSPTINFDAYYGVNSIIKKQAVLSPYEFVRLMKEVYSAYTDTIYLNNAKLDDYKGVSAIDWQDEILHNAPFASYNLALRGGIGIIWI